MRGGQLFLAVVAGLMLSSRLLEAGNIWENWILSGSTVRAVITGMEVVLSLASRLSALRDVAPVEKPNNYGIHSEI
jgi:hypothetical protein